MLLEIVRHSQSYRATHFQSHTVFFLLFCCLSRAQWCGINRFLEGNSGMDEIDSSEQVIRLLLLPFPLQLSLNLPFSAGLFRGWDHQDYKRGFTLYSKYFRWNLVILCFVSIDSGFLSEPEELRRETRPWLDRRHLRIDYVETRTIKETIQVYW